MPLFTQLRINANEILELRIVRLDRTPDSEIKDHHTFMYRVTCRENNENGTTLLGHVEHRYSDGAKVLAQKALSLTIEKLGS